MTSISLSPPTDAQRLRRVHRAPWYSAAGCQRQGDARLAVRLQPAPRRNYQVGPGSLWEQPGTIIIKKKTTTTKKMIVD